MIFYRDVMKPLAGRSLAVIFLILFWWVLAAIAVAVFIDDPGSVLFVQRRVGKKMNGRLACFKILKFRTMKMSTPKDVPTHLLQNPEQYITKVGRILRKYSLDELPQVFNILVGDLAWIGPRPALYNQHDLISLRERYGINDLAPGITGWAQVNGRDEISIPVKVEFDRYYKEKMCKNSLSGFLMDMRCLTRTFGAVLSSEGNRDR